MSLVADLPDDICKLIMQHVPLEQRLSSCALVCQKFKAAAVAATDSIKTTLSEQPAADKFATYLQQHGSHLTSLILDGYDIGPLLEQLPCQQLRDLCFIEWHLRFGPEQGLPGVLSHTTSLTRLELERARLLPQGCAAALAFPRNLHHLCVSCTWSPQKDRLDAGAVFVWETLQHLTHLDLRGLRVEADSLARISSVTNLRVLILHDCGCRMVHPEQPLPPLLQHLFLNGLLGPSVLAAATQLTHLVLHYGHIEGEGGVSGGARLLGVLPKLQHLDTLCLRGQEVDWTPPSPAYQALVTCSRKLRVLYVEGCDLPNGALAHMFPSAPSHNIMLTRLEDVAIFGTPWDAAAVASLVRCCPALLQLGMESKGSAHLTALNQLSAFTQLDLFLDAEADSVQDSESDSVDGASTAVSVQGLAGLTRLKALFLRFGTSEQSWAGGGLQVQPEALLPLTALRQLAELSCSCPLNIILTSQAGPGQPPDAWLQLLEYCVEQSTCRAAIVCDVAQQLSEQEATNSQQQQELSELRQQLAEQQQQLANLQQQLAGQPQAQAQQQHNVELQE